MKAYIYIVKLRIMIKCIFSKLSHIFRSDYDFILFWVHCCFKFLCSLPFWGVVGTIMVYIGILYA